MASDVTAGMRIPGGKVGIPDLPADFTPRQRLRRRLDQAAPGQMILVSAPAGSGKTLLLADWVRHAQGPATAWVSLDAEDNEPRRLWSAVLASLLALPSLAADDRLRRIAQDAELAREGDLVEELTLVLESLRAPVRIVLDDVHELTGKEVVRDLARVVRRLPDTVQLVLASRSDPPVSVPRLRLEGRLCELRADDLRFSREDTSGLLTAAGLSLPRSQVAVLHARTQGWAAGIRLAALALRHADNTAAFLAEFSGDERSVADYLTGEILDGLSRDVRNFLRVVSLCFPMPAPLAAELSGRPDAESMLEELRGRTALVERTSRGTYGLQPLLRSHLAADLARHDPENYRRLQAVAARWWFARDHPVHALRHAERAGDDALITDLLHRCGVALLLRGDMGPLRRALAAVDADARAADPWLALIAAITHLEARALPAAAAELDDARRGWPSTADAALDALRASAELLAAGQGLPSATFAGSPDDAGQTQPEMEALLHASRGAAALTNAAGVDPQLAERELERALAFARAQDIAFLEVQSLAMLATLAGTRGDYPGMVATAKRAVAVAARRGRHPSAWTAGPAAMLAYADLLGGHPSIAAACSEEALSTRDALPPELTYTLHAVHGAAVADQGRRAAGLAEIQAARSDFGETHAPPSMLAALALLEHRVAVLIGNQAAAARVAEWMRSRVGETAEGRVLAAWAELAAGRYEAARIAVAPVFEPGQPILLPHTTVEAYLVDAEAALQADDPDAGEAALDAALAAAEPIGATRPFALAGRRTRMMVTSRAADDGRGPFSAHLAAALAAVEPDPAVPLSERERAILELLPTLMNAHEIAAEFTISVNTVKSHIRSIYGKLGVSSRREAVLRARDRGLVP